MPTAKLIQNPNQAYGLGGTWQTGPFDNQMSSSIASFVNNSGQILYTGDIVALDVTGVLVAYPTAALTTAIGTVAGWYDYSQYTGTTFPTIESGTYMTAVGGIVVPPSIHASQSLSLGFTNGSGNITSALVSTNNPLFIGAYVLTPYNSSTNANPQVFKVTSNGGSSGAWTAVGTVVSGAGTTFSGTTGSFTSQVVDTVEAIGPGWPNNPGWSNSSAFPPNANVPVCTAGYGRVNVNAIATVNAGDLLTGTSASAIATRIASGAATAAAIGTGIAVALEAQSAKDTTLTTAGITGHDSIRCIVKTF